MKLSLLALGLLILFSCKEEPAQKEIAQEATEEFNKLDIDKELATIEELRNGFQLAIKEKRYGDLAQYAMADMKAVSPGSTEWLEYRKQREERLGKFSYDSIIMNPQETIILSDSMAYDYGTSTVYYTNDKGESVELYDTFIVILKKDKADGKWKMYREVASAIVD